MSTITYVCKQHPAFQFRVDNVRVKFENHHFKTDDPELIKAIDNLIATKPIFKQKISKADPVAAAQLAKSHMEKHGGAVKGGITASAISALQETTQLSNRDAQFDALGSGADKIKDELAKDGLILTEQTSPEPEAAENSAPSLIKK